MYVAYVCKIFSLGMKTWYRGRILISSTAEKYMQYVNRRF